MQEPLSLEEAPHRTTPGAAAALSTRRRRCQVIPILAALCVAAVVSTQAWRMGLIGDNFQTESAGFNSPSMRASGLINGKLERSQPERDTYRFAHEFATKTAYWTQRSGKRQLGVDLQSRVFRPDLLLVQTQIVARHGIRYPTGGNIREMLTLLEKLAPVSTALPTWLRNYSLPYNLSIEGELADTGRQEMRELADRTLRNMGQSSPVEYSTNTFKVAHTSVRRTGESAISFVSAFFSNPTDVQYIEYPEANDTLLRFFDRCPRYQREVKTNKTALAQASLFAEAPLVAHEIDALKKSLGLTDHNVTFNFKDLSAVYTACAFDFALYNRTSDWCSLMTESFVRAFDFSDDLHEFYLIGGGYKINYEMAALLLRELVGNMKAAATGSTKQEGAFYFAHAETTLPLMTLMGYGDRTLLKADFTVDEIRKRSFRTSRLAPFAANVEFRLYRRTSNSSAYVVQILANGRQVKVPGCDRIYCSLEELEQQWRFYLEEYDFQQDCA